LIRWTVVLGVLAAVVVVALAAWAWWHVPLLYPEPMPGGQESVRAEPTVAPSEGRERGRGKRSGVPRASRADTARRGEATRQLVGLSEAAAYADVFTRTLRRYMAQGRLTGYRVGPRLVKVDLSELDQLPRPIPTARGPR
jgi:excisionase family DNA binding protein